MSIAKSAPPRPAGSPAPTAGPGQPSSVESFGPQRFSNRELSRLDFGARLLDLAEDAVAGPARAGQVHRHLRRAARRVLPGARRRASRTRWPPACGPARSTGCGPASSSPRSASASSSSSQRQDRIFLDQLVPALAGGRHPLLGLRRARRRRPRPPRRGLPAPDLPGAHAAGRRPGPPVPEHLEPLAQPRGPGRATRSPASGGSRGSRSPPCCRASSSCPTASASSPSSRSSPPTSTSSSPA